MSPFLYWCADDSGTITLDTSSDEDDHHRHDVRPGSGAGQETVAAGGSHHDSEDAQDDHEGESSERSASESDDGSVHHPKRANATGPLSGKRRDKVAAARASSPLDLPPTKGSCEEDLVEDGVACCL